jgi:Fe-S-cluster-containing dehydrogenase component/formate-dependent nitrite reductase membrane component NrfD
VRYGFAIDHRKCIGCHACTVACKEEHDVPLGVFRTWVKYVERGTFPDAKRYFTVLRCNHCDNAPCVTICPTRALHTRADGIVDFNSDLCIGCKSCLQACPYDALYIDPRSHTAAKCNYCAHRVEVGLEPACVIVCPERAIVAGDLDDPASAIARLVANEPAQVRKPEQRTQPKIFYVGADAAALTPSLHEPAERLVWAERTDDDAALVRALMEAPLPVAVASTRDVHVHAPISRPTQAGDTHAPAPVSRPEAYGTAAVSRPTYDVSHAVFPWGWKVAAYLWTKSIAAGVLLVPALSVLFGSGAEDIMTHNATRMFAPAIALLFLALTLALLVLDLKRPERFLYILLKPNPRSWLVIGSWVLMAYGAAAAIWLAIGASDQSDWYRALAPVALVLAAAAAGYSAFLFGQAEGRDFWQSRLTLPHLLVAAIVAGAATLVLVQAVVSASPAYGAFVRRTLAASLALEGLTLVLEYARKHAHEDAARAAHLVTRGPWRTLFFGGVVGAGIAIPLALLATASHVPAAAPLAAALALAGLLIYEHVWVRAGQAVPLS